MRIKAFKTRVFEEDENLTDFILEYLQALPEESVLALTSKIVSLSEGRTTSIKERKSLIKKESNFSIPNSWFTIKDNMVMAAAGVDESNGNGKLILLPKNSYKSAENIRRALKKKFKLKKLGVLITDSGFLPLRRGSIGIALGYAGFKGVKNYIGTKDLFSRKLKYTRANIADSLATAVVLSFGEGSEQKPLALITGAPVVFSGKIDKKEMNINPKEDIYHPLLKKLKNEKKKKK